MAWQWPVNSGRSPGVNRISVILLHSIYSRILTPCRSHSQSVAVRWVPVDSSAARIPLPAATIFWALSLSSFFCSVVRKGYEWAMIIGLETWKGEKGQPPFLTDFFMGETQKCWASLQSQTTRCYHTMLSVSVKGKVGQRHEHLSCLSLKPVATLRLVNSNASIFSDGDIGYSFLSSRMH